MKMKKIICYLNSGIMGLLIIGIGLVLTVLLLSFYPITSRVAHLTIQYGLPFSLPLFIGGLIAIPIAIFISRRWYLFSIERSGRFNLISLLVLVSFSAVGMLG